jgi:hypothetical protein
MRDGRPECVIRFENEVAIPIPPGLLAIGRQEIGPARRKIAADMLDDDGNVIRARRVSGKTPLPKPEWQESAEMIGNALPRSKSGLGAGLQLTMSRPAGRIPGIEFSLSLPGERHDRARNHRRDQTAWHRVV